MTSFSSASPEGVEAVEVVVEEAEEIFGILVEQDVFVPAQAVQEVAFPRWCRRKRVSQD